MRFSQNVGNSLEIDGPRAIRVVAYLFGNRGMVEHIRTQLTEYPPEDVKTFLHLQISLLDRAPQVFDAMRDHFAAGHDVPDDLDFTGADAWWFLQAVLPEIAEQFAADVTARGFGDVCMEIIDSQDPPEVLRELFLKSGKYLAG
ncbi:hypothetical protein [Blastopirellula marina]|uniref:Uncharacterized protein n=1 Tax=Blastopirellula marina DSM 3645 TaxID=314230 RepID=A3ZUY3_9BACT|nr:hypothetical protein [Blastopirellula marina]EAQ79719.1 hypothetical protein DSM3645_24460 [Blastopirellula marina DSM 3645]